MQGFAAKGFNMEANGALHVFHRIAEGCAELQKMAKKALGKLNSGNALESKGFYSRKVNGIGSRERARTSNPPVNSRLLYH